MQAYAWTPLPHAACQQDMPCRLQGQTKALSCEIHSWCREMLDTPGPYLLDVMVPHIEHVLPMIPGGASFKDVITTGDGSMTYS